MRGVGPAAYGSSFPQRIPGSLHFTEDMYVDEAFTSDTGQFTQFSIGGAGSFSLSSGTGVVTNSTGSQKDRFVLCGSPIVHPVAWIQVDIIAETGEPNNWNIGSVGIAKDSQNSIYAEHDSRNNQTRITVEISGVFTTYLVSHTVLADFQMALSVYKNRLAVYVDSTMSENWTQVLALDVPTSVVDLVSMDLTGWFPSFGASSSDNATSVWTFDNLRAWTSRIDYFDIFPSSLVLFSDDFSSDTGQLSVSGSSPASVSISGGTCSLVGAGAGTTFAQFSGGPEITMPQCFSKVRVLSQTTAAGRVGVGIMTDSTHYVFARYSRVNSNVSVIVADGGSESILFSAAYSGLPPFDLGLSVVGNSCCAWVDDGNGWAVMASGDVGGTLDLKTLVQAGSEWLPALYESSTGAYTVVLDGYGIGRFGACGLRDFGIVVTSDDGIPLVSSGVVTFTGTANDGRGMGYMGVFELDLVTRYITQTAVVMVGRSSTVQNDIDSQIIAYPNGDRRLFIATWANGFGGSLEILHKLVTGADLLSGSHIVSGMATLALTKLNGTPGSGRYHCQAVKRGGTWLVCYDVTTNTSFGGNTFFIAVDSSPDLVDFTAVADDSPNRDYEGSHQFWLDGRQWYMTGGPTICRMYDADLNYIGNLDVEFAGGSDTRPHPVIFEYGSEQILLGFDNVRFAGASFTWGNIRLHRSRRYK